MLYQIHNYSTEYNQADAADSEGEMISIETTKQNEITEQTKYFE